MATKIPVHCDKDMEKLANLSFEACAAYFDETDEVRVVGEVVSANSQPISEYREVQVIVYDSDGDILGRNYTNWGDFQIRQSFEVKISELPAEPSRVRVFPSM